MELVDQIHLSQNQRYQQISSDVKNSNAMFRNYYIQHWVAE